MKKIERKIPFTTMQKGLEVISAGVIIGLVVYLIMIWPSIPEEIPAHYDMRGNVDRWSGKGSMIACPMMITIALYLLLTVLSFFPAAWNTPVKITEKNCLFVYQNIRSLICWMKLVLIIDFTYISLCIALQKGVGAFFVPFVFLAILLVITWYLYKIVKKSKKIASEE